ncbi:DUF11 domain-containing protein [Asticcacaulis sp. YBE204]|uniref:DUF11 domain-containing protein n=1 Tax=Asticcacaulis sp. YBE204 TaxID=1282363 RepID=UPI0012DED2B0|nr:DUF11 domain-containing protein [Asticcacaulis sp. YBE204]
MTLAASGQALAADAITNTAYLQTTLGGEPVRLASNTQTLRLTQLLDVRLQNLNEDELVAEAKQDDFTAIFFLTNSGTHLDTFSLSAQLNNPKVTLRGLWIDRNNDGAFDPDIDTPVTDGIPLQAGETVSILAVSQIGDMADDERATLSLTANSRTGTGPAGTVFSGAGVNGLDAMTGKTGGTATAEARIVVVNNDREDDGSGNGGVTLSKSFAVTTLSGPQPTRGDIITYTLIATFPTNARASGARIIDAIPAGTTYIPGSLTLDGAVLTDATDSDAGAYDTSAQSLGIALGDPAGAATRTVTFKVTIQ